MHAPWFILKFVSLEEEGLVGVMIAEKTLQQNNYWFNYFVQKKGFAIFSERHDDVE